MLTCFPFSPYIRKLDELAVDLLVHHLNDKPPAHRTPATATSGSGSPGHKHKHHA